MFNDKPTNGKKTKVDEYTYEDDCLLYKMVVVESFKKVA